MKAMFFNMTRREQIYVLVMVAAVGLWLLFTFALAPASAAREAMKASNESAINLLARVDAKATELIRIRQEGSTQNNGSLVSAISRSSELAGLPVRRLQPNSRGEVQVRYEAVDYDDLARWLYLKAPSSKTTHCLSTTGAKSSWLSTRSRTPCPLARLAHAL